MKQYVVDAFTDKVFSGNPAAVCVMDERIPDELMQNIAIENNLSETAFAVREEEGRYLLRWFTPGGEVDLCGHATLGTSFVILNYYDKSLKRVTFDTLQSGELTVVRRGDLYEMDFPAYELTKVPVTDAMEEATGTRPVKAFIGRDLLCVYENEETIRKMQPDMGKLLELDGLLLNVTAPGRDFDCVSRSFAPKLSIPEDPVCGSGHCHIIPYWTEVTGKTELTAYQASRRGGVLYCRTEGNRIKLSGKAAVYSESELLI